MRRSLVAALWLGFTGCTYDWSVSRADAGGADAGAPDVAIDGSEPVSEADARTEGGDWERDADAPADAADTGEGDGEAGDACTTTQRWCDGACVDADDARHCGACGHDCTSLLNVAGPATCRSGICQVPAGSCSPGHAHCSIEPDDGCEADITTPARCGACDAACDPSTPLCATTDGSSRCVSSCAAGEDQCGTRCLQLQSSTLYCGQCGRACPTLSNAHPACSQGECASECNDGFHDCGRGCVSLNATFACGVSCSDCQAPIGGSSSCNAGQCAAACPSDTHQCGTTCVSDTSPASCGSSCVACPVPLGGTATCTQGACGYTCPNGPYLCSGQCCSQITIGNENMNAGSYTIPARTLWWSGIVVMTPARAVLVGLRTEGAGVRFRVGLFRTEGSNFRLLAQTDVLTSVANGKVEAQITPTQIDPGTLSVVIMTDDTPLIVARTNVGAGSTPRALVTTFEPFKTVIEAQGVITTMSLSTYVRTIPLN